MFSISNSAPPDSGPPASNKDNPTSQDASTIPAQKSPAPPVSAVGPDRPSSTPPRTGPYESSGGPRRSARLYNKGMSGTAPNTPKATSREPPKEPPLHAQVARLQRQEGGPTPNSPTGFPLPVSPVEGTPMSTAHIDLSIPALPPGVLDLLTSTPLAERQVSEAPLDPATLPPITSTKSAGARDRS